MSVLGKRPTEEELAAQQEKSDFVTKRPYEYHCTGEALKDVAKKSFFENSNLYKWRGALGEYTIWAYKKVGQMSRAEHAWPRAYAHEESQTINAGMWFPVGDEFKLVAVWAFSTFADETSLYYLAEYQDDVWALSEACDEMNDDPSPITSEASAEHFSVSSGDCEVEKFTCFSLDTISAAEMATFEEAFKNQSQDEEESESEPESDAD